MSSVPLKHEALSLKLSEVLDDIGINNEMVMKRRTSALFIESVQTTTCNHLIPNQMNKSHFFGSQTEGSTSIGIDSDDDYLICLNKYNVIHDWADWIHGITNLLMIRDENTAPGYCLLQRLRDDEPLPATLVPPRDAYYKDAKGRVLLKNMAFWHYFERLGYAQHGPAAMCNRPGVREADCVVAFHCDSWPMEGRQWLNRRGMSGWPSAQLKLESETSGCFLVPVSSKISTGLDEFEWSISTSLAERYLVFSFNITQMKCYVFMKMLLKSYNALKEVISSYMCKTALFHCIENTNSDFWQDRNLFLCINQSLRTLYNFIYYKNCPHFIIPENNLMAGRISTEQRQELLVVIQHIISSNGTVLFDIVWNKRIYQTMHSFVIKNHYRFDLGIMQQTSTCLDCLRLSVVVIQYVDTVASLYGICHCNCICYLKNS